ncbi:bactofilin family protein [Shewanella gaetbuli]
MNNKGKGITFIGADMSLNGEMDIQGPALIAGKISGTVRSSDVIKIEPSGEVEGEIYCQELRVSGVLKGKLFCNKLVIVSTGVVEADVSSHDMEIYDGGQFIGMRTTGPSADVLPKPTQSEATADSTAANNAVQKELKSSISHSTSQSSAETKASVDATTQNNSQTQERADKPVKKSNKGVLAIAVVVLAAGGVWQFGGFKQTNDLSETSVEPALFTPPSASTDTVAEKNAAKLLQDVQAEQILAEQEAPNSEQVVDDAMEDLDAMAMSNEQLADNMLDSDQQATIVESVNEMTAEAEMVNKSIIENNTDNGAAN